MTRVRCAARGVTRGLLGLGLLVAGARPARAQNTIEIRIENSYGAYFDALLGTAVRIGNDSLGGTLTLQGNGTWQGVLTASVAFTQTMKAFGMVVCPEFEYKGTQRLNVTARPVRGFNSQFQSITYQTGTANGGTYELVVKPAGPPVMNSTKCLDLYDDGSGVLLLPLNDSRWNDPAAHYIIGLPAAGTLAYEDLTVDAFTDPNVNPPNMPIQARSTWNIRITRR